MCDRKIKYIFHIFSTRSNLILEVIMKKLIVLGVLLVAVICTFCLVNHKEEDYLRIHIRANSNSEYDQQIKYQVKDTVVSALKPIVDSIQSKDDMINILNQNVEYLTMVVDNKLRELGQNYTSKIRISEEKFPTRSYEELTLGAGVYDAIIIELGSGKGDNWWCVAYPPLCFVTAEGDGENIEYKSIFSKWLSN